MSDEIPRISIALVVGGDDFNPELLSQAIGIDSTRVWLQKIPHLRERPDLPNCEWEYKLEKFECWSIDDAIRQMLNVFWSKKEILSSFVSGNNLSTAIVLYVFNKDADPEYVISLDTMKQIVELEAELCMQLDE